MNTHIADIAAKFLPFSSRTRRRSVPVIANQASLDELRALSALHRKLSSAQLATLVNSYRAQRVTSDDPRIPLSVAVEATRRIKAMEPHDSQLRAAIALVQGHIVQLRTGEGKTLVAMLAAIHHGFHDRACHVMTVNGYLAERDIEELRPIFKAVGLNVGLTQPGMTAVEKRSAYQADVVYGPGFEFGFDYLRDRLAEQSVSRQLGNNVLRRWRLDLGKVDRIQGPLDVAIVDEADSVMLDEATTPLILSTVSQRPNPYSNTYEAARDAARQLSIDVDFRLTSETRSIHWLDHDATRRLAPPRQVVARLVRSWTQYLEQALLAEHALRRDVNYVVQDGRIYLVDQQTGRIMPDRTWGGGLQQAVEAKERLAISEETQTAATISRQRFLRGYQIVSGLTGTAEGSHREFREVYGTEVVEVPSHRPTRMLVLPAILCVDRESHEYTIVSKVMSRCRRGQPVLIGTTSILSSERLSRVLSQVGIKHQLLSGRQDENEATLIATAGRAGVVTIATNIAGRGTDIRLGDGVAAQGGLHVVATELFALRRIEQQLMGRAGRQGDPGSFELIVSADDALLQRFASSKAEAWKRKLARGPIIEAEWLPEVRRLQESLERQGFTERQALFAHDDWKQSMLRELAPG